MSFESISSSFKSPIQKINLDEEAQKEAEKFKFYYLWLERAMSRAFFEEVSADNLMLITHSLMGFELQDYFSIIHLKNAAMALCLDSPEADLRILSNFSLYGIKNYQAYVSKEPVPFPGLSERLRIAVIDFTEVAEITNKSLTEETKNGLWNLLKEEDRSMTREEFYDALEKMTSRFVFALPRERLLLAIHLFFRSKTRDSCQYEIRYEENWQEKGTVSMYIVLAWRNTPKYHFLYRLAKIVFRHGLSMKRVNATYTDPYSKQSILIMALSLHGSNGQAVWDVADIPDFVRELTTIKYFSSDDCIEKSLIDSGLISGNLGNLIRAMIPLIHQSLLNIDTHLYTKESIEEALCRHPDFTLQLCEAFKLRFDPNHVNLDQFFLIRNQFLIDLKQLDTGQEENDLRRKNVLFQAMNIVTHILKTNFYRFNYTALSFRLDPNYLNEIPDFDRQKYFPELPYGIFYIYGMHFFGFHIRFRDLARGGLRTILPENVEQMVAEQNHVFTECYHLAWTQNKKNKDIPEAGSKGLIFLDTFSKIDFESPILKKELQKLKIDPEEITQRIKLFQEERKTEYLHQSQRAFIENLLVLVNCYPDGALKPKLIVDYWKRPEYLYVGPDENMQDSMIEWIAHFSEKHAYKPGAAFISSKPSLGINHKTYGVTSLGLNVYMHKVLEYLNIQPIKDPFTIKLSGGPDGDVAGNQLLNLYYFYPNTAKVVALTDKTGTIRDDLGLNLGTLKDLFIQGKGIAFYPPQQLSDGGFLINKEIKRYPTPYSQETLCLRKVNNQLEEDWLSGSQVNYLLRLNVHQTPADIFIPAGGRPRTLNKTNIHEFIDEKGKPTARAIIEGANLYLDSKARSTLEEKGVLIIKDSSANKCGVICSSFEVLCGLTLKKEVFLSNKDVLVHEILERLKICASEEADLLLKTHKQTGEYLTALSDRLSTNINRYTHQLLGYFDLMRLSNTPQDPMIRCFLDYCLPTLSEKFSIELLNEVPEHHKKAIIACYLACQMIYKQGIDWTPSIIDIVPFILSGHTLN